MDECAEFFLLDCDVTPKLGRITTAEPKAKPGILKGPRVYPWGSIRLRRNTMQRLDMNSPQVSIPKGSPTSLVVAKWISRLSQMPRAARGGGELYNEIA